MTGAGALVLLLYGAQALGQLARILLQRLRQLHGGRAGQIAVGRHLGGFESRFVASAGRELFQRVRQVGEQVFFNRGHQLILRLWPACSGVSPVLARPDLLKRTMGRPFNSYHFYSCLRTCLFG